jgi:hypothetical protein
MGFCIVERNSGIADIFSVVVQLKTGLILCDSSSRVCNGSRRFPH